MKVRHPPVPPRPGPGLHDSVSMALLEMIAEHRPSFPEIPEIALRAGQDEEAVRAVFDSVQDILDTLAEQGLMKLFDVSLRTVTQAPPDDPIAQFRALGTAYLNWAIENPAQFRLLQHSKLVDLEANENLARYVRAMHDTMLRLLANAQDAGQIERSTNIHSILVSGRCLLFGLARMAIDGNMTAWHPGLNPADAAHQAFSDYMDSMAAAGNNLTGSLKPQRIEA
ncbi:TetR-like C-terminal domain-containing protein [uncultured Paracoccus sp.]|uniref:TetR-like C-terminal domain-containing protein n=1 Tax=uncultured Paracoccus sp. TaxID=189685 RepID=UPI00261114E8|nr:TetR-like C-terminal domain-containing protein [uncultured Paracoccus sp.]